MERLPEGRCGRGFETVWSEGPVTKRDGELLAEIEATDATAPALWWLGHSGFVIKFESIVFYVDPCLSNAGRTTRLFDPPIDRRKSRTPTWCCVPTLTRGIWIPAELRPSCKQAHAPKVILPKSVATHARRSGLPYERMTTTDSGLRVEFFKNGPVWPGVFGPIRASGPGLDSDRRLSISRVPDPLR